MLFWRNSENLNIKCINFLETLLMEKKVLFVTAAVVCFHILFFPLHSQSSVYSFNSYLFSFSLLSLILHLSVAPPDVPNFMWALSLLNPTWTFFKFETVFKMSNFLLFTIWFSIFPSGFSFTYSWSWCDPTLCFCVNLVSHLDGVVLKYLSDLWFLCQPFVFLTWCLRPPAGLSIHTFHGNFFVRSTDLLSLPNVNPDAGFAVQMSIEENLDDMQVVSFQAALLYTSSKGTRRCLLWEADASQLLFLKMVLLSSQGRGGSGCTLCVSLWSVLCPISLRGLMFKPLLDCWLAWVSSTSAKLGFVLTLRCWFLSSSWWVLGFSSRGSVGDGQPEWRQRRHD